MATMENGRSAQMLAERKARIEHFIEKYSFLPASAAATASNMGHALAPAPRQKVVLLTGTTGNLGSDLLSILLVDPTVSKVYALNRASKEGSSRERVGDLFLEKGLPEYLLDSPKVVLLEGNLGQPKLGLADQEYEELLDQVTIVIHNAWPVGYIQPLSHFESSLLGLYNLVAFTRAISKAKNPRFVFISSTASAFLYRVYEKDKPLPEELQHNPGIAIGLGYAESKYIGEYIVARSGLNAASLRVNQLCGRTSDGAWPIAEWLPMMMKLMQELKTIPAVMTMKGVAWLPTDVAANVIRDISLSPLHLPPILNVCHPCPAKWDVFYPVMERFVWGNRPPKVLPTLEWTKLVEREVRERMGRGAAKFIDRLFSLLSIVMPFNPVFDDATASGDFPACSASTHRAQELSYTLRNLPQIRTKDAERWVKYWINIGFLEPDSTAQVEARL